MTVPIQAQNLESQNEILYSISAGMAQSEVMSYDRKITKTPRKASSPLVSFFLVLLLAPTIEPLGPIAPKEISAEE